MTELLASPSNVDTQPRLAVSTGVVHNCIADLVTRCNHAKVTSNDQK